MLYNNLIVVHIIITVAQKKNETFNVNISFPDSWPSVKTLSPPYNWITSGDKF